MMIRKMAVAACFAALLAMVSAPASAAAYLIGGTWYFFSLDFAAEIGGVTGKDIKAGTNLFAQVDISMADVLCANPQGYSVQPGVGPKGSAFTTTEDITEDDLSRKLDKVKGKTYVKTAVVKDLVDEGVRLTPPTDLCKQANTNTYWLPVFWQDRVCKKGLSGSELTALANEGYPICYRDLAIKDANEGLVYITGPNSGRSVGNEIVWPYADPNVKKNWTFVYLPTAFTGTSKVLVDDVVTDTITGSCTFPLNTEEGAKFSGDPYSLRNPPVNGWASLPVGDERDYFCQ